MKIISAKGIVAVFLSLAMTCGMFSAQVAAATTASEEVSGIAEFAVEKLVEVGMRTAAETCDKIGEASENEDVEKLFSFVSNWVLSDGAEAGTAKITKLCEEILEEIKELEEDIEEGFSVVEGMTGESLAAQAKNSLENQWESDVETPIREANVNNALRTYKKYLDDSTKYNPYSISGTDKATLEKDLDNLLSDFLDICSENTSMSTSKDEKLNTMFLSNGTNTVFKQLISDLAIKLNDTTGGTVYQHAGQYAWNSLAFSDQQYQFIYSYAQKQIYQIVLVCMLYDEYLYQQGNYIAEHTIDNTNSSEYKNFLDYEKNLGELISGTVYPEISAMLNSRIQVATGEYLTLDSLVKPEDFAGVNLKINDYKNYYEFCHDAEQGKYLYSSSSEYIKSTNRFNRVATRSGNKNYVFYILDSAQFSGDHSTNAIVMDTKNDIKFGCDVHVSSADYHNLTQKTMSDGANIFKNQKDIFRLFNTNNFRINGSKPSAYLGNLIPNHEGCTTLLMTPEYDNDYSKVFSTAYAEYKVIDCNKNQDGTTVETTKYSGEDFQLDHGGEKYYYSVVLANQGSDYCQNIKIAVPQHIEASVYDSNGNVLISNTKNTTSSAITAKSGEMLTFKFKLDDGYSIDSFKCVRNNATQTVTELFDYDDKDLIKKDGDYYIFNYPMPYSDSTFEISEIDDEQIVEINTAEDLISLSEKVNSGSNVRASLNSDIDLTGYESKLKPIGTSAHPFRGIFDGNNLTISGLNITDNSEFVGLFGKSVGTIKNLVVKGDIKLSQSQSFVGGVVGDADGGEISNVQSYVNISNTAGALVHTGGVVGSVENNTTVIDKCAYFGTMNIINSNDCIGGVVGYTNHGAVITNCANLGNVSASRTDAFVGGILGYANNTYYSLKNCYSYGTVSNGDSTKYCGAIIGWARNYGSGKITNNYYLTSSAKLAFGSDSKSGLSATSCSSAEFKSGMVTYHLNKGNSATIWYQNIDLGHPQHNYPVFEGKTVYLLGNNRYANQLQVTEDETQPQPTTTVDSTSATETQSNTSGNSTPDQTNEGAVQTGQTFPAILLVLILLAGCTVMVVWRKSERS